MSTGEAVEPQPCTGPISGDSYLLIGIFIGGLIGAALAGSVGFLMGAIIGMIFAANAGEEFEKRK